MEKSTDAELIDRCLAFAADKIGDLHPPVLEKYHDRLPGAKAELARHDDSGELEHSMVEQALYCLMTWFVRPMEVQIVLRETVPHHIQTLMVPLPYLEELINALIDVVGEAVPLTAEAELITLNKLQKELQLILREAVIP
ncbi:hypothetical protein F0M18_08200 [Pseudohalioglobus sediminis]|uniref:Uncharacterized protein n=1 Tax=Pseudohalioglobus sediminis TaxID=2606449 RepID=A0A5B0WZX3_9GAMM|nr:hypothetical protein [Pseudohalioglobus sediminis]KAA1192634.1 hypothetical protein F0M18_08200 [Pseudohalioglobus sediminis]